MSVNTDMFYAQHFRSKHQDKSDDELRQITLNNARKITAMPTSATPAMLAEAEKLLAESKVCSAILSERNERRKARREAIEAWREGQEADKLAAIMNLPVGATANGQLVAAILEDEGPMTMEAIAGWCDELSELSEEDLQALLAGLVKERIIGLDKEAYFLRQAVTPTLYPDKLAEWTVEELNDMLGVLHGGRAFLALYILEEERHPMSVDDFIEEQGGYRVLQGAHPGLDDSDFEGSDLDWRMALNALQRHNLVDRLTLNGSVFYYFPLIGRFAPMNELQNTERPNKPAPKEGATAVQQANEKTMDLIYAVLVREGREMTISDIKAADPELDDLSNQRISALVRQLVNEGSVERVEHDRMAFFIAKAGGKSK